MSRVCIVTDSTAQFLDGGRLARTHQIEIVPLNIHFGSQTLRDGVDIDAEEMFYRVRNAKVMPTVSAPTVEDFATIYETLCKTTGPIYVVTHSQHLTETYANAQSARAGFLGRCNIVIIDSQTTSVGQGILVEAIATAAWAGASPDEIMWIARQVIPRLYSVYCVESLEYIQRAGLIGDAQTILGTMLAIKPLLTIEDGKLIAMEKARLPAQVVDKLVEFVVEFTQIERLAILQNTTRLTEQTRALQDRLALDFSGLEAPVMLYEPLLCTLIGPDGIGVVVYEGMDEEATIRKNSGDDILA